MEKKYKIQNIKYQKSTLVLKLEGIETVEDAEKLKNSYIEVTRDQAGELEDGVYYIADLIGMDVYTDEGTLIGKLDDIYNYGSSDIYVVKNDLGKQVLLPAIEEVIKNVDLENSKITVHLINGLI
mgnify:FL=1